MPLDQQKSRLQLPLPPVIVLVLGLSMTTFSTASAESGSFGRSWGFAVDELGYEYSDSTDTLLVWDSDFYYDSGILTFHWLLEGEWAPKASAFEGVENRLLADSPISDSFYIRAGIRLDTPPGGSDRTFAVFSITGEALENLDLESNLYLGEDSETLVELDAEYELEITPRIALTGTLEALFAVSEDVEFGVGTGLNSTEASLRLSYSDAGEVFSPYVGVFYEREYGDTAELAQAEGDDIDAWVAVIGTRLAF